MTEWEPATEVEAAMRDALRAGDQELYFRILARSELLLPVSADALAGRAAMGWGTWTTGGRTHVLAFTSGEALRICLADNAGSARRMPYHELAGSWPNLEWWLAVNPGLPIEGYLPAWFVAQLSRGDVRLPGRTMGARARLERAESAARARATGVVPGQVVQPSPTSPLSRAERLGRMSRAADQAAARRPTTIEGTATVNPPDDLPANGPRAVLPAVSDEAAGPGDQPGQPGRTATDRGTASRPARSRPTNRAVGAIRSVGGRPDRRRTPPRSSAPGPVRRRAGTRRRVPATAGRPTGWAPCPPFRRRHPRPAGSGRRPAVDRRRVHAAGHRAGVAEPPARAAVHAAARAAATRSAAAGIPPTPRCRRRPGRARPPGPASAGRAATADRPLSARRAAVRRSARRRGALRSRRSRRRDRRSGTTRLRRPTVRPRPRPRPRPRHPARRSPDRSRRSRTRTRRSHGEPCDLPASPQSACHRRAGHRPRRRARPRPPSRQPTSPAPAEPSRLRAHRPTRRASPIEPAARHGRARRPFLLAGSGPPPAQRRPRSRRSPSRPPTMSSRWQEPAPPHPPPTSRRPPSTSSRPTTSRRPARRRRRRQHRHVPVHPAAGPRCCCRSPPDSGPDAQPGERRASSGAPRRIDGEPYVVVFTSPERLAEHLDDEERRTHRSPSSSSS